MFESKKKKKNRYLIVIGESNIVQKQISIFTYIELFLYAIIFETVQILRICVLKDLLEISKIERPKYSKNSTGFYMHIGSFYPFFRSIRSQRKSLINREKAKKEYCIACLTSVC